MHHTELYLGIRFLIVGIALAFVFVPLIREKALRRAVLLSRIKVK
jgi:hypothetical protein